VACVRAGILAGQDIEPDALALALIENRLEDR